jgi:hypothetical protein
MWHNRKDTGRPFGFARLLPCKAATSEEARRTLRDVESLRDARPPLAGFVNSLLGIISALWWQWDRCQTMIETVKLFGRKGFIL